MVLLFATAVFAVISNFLLIAPRMRTPKARLTVGGFVAHAGVGLVLMGIASLVLFGQKAERIQLIKNVPENRLGYKLTYKGMTSQPFDRDHNAIRIEVEKDGRIWEARPRFYFAPWENKDSAFANPPKTSSPYAKCWCCQRPHGPEGAGEGRRLGRPARANLSRGRPSLLERASRVKVATNVLATEGHNGKSRREPLCPPVGDPARGRRG